MAYGIRGVAAIPQHLIECIEAGDGLILAERAEQVRKFVFGNIEPADGFSQGDQNRMSWHTVVTSVELAFPLLKQFEGGGAVADFVAQIVGDAAVGVDIEKMLTKPAGRNQLATEKFS